MIDEAIASTSTNQVDTAALGHHAAAAAAGPAATYLPRSVPE